MTDHLDLARTTYLLVLGREAADEEAAAVVRALDAGVLSPLDFVASALASPEATARLAPAAPPTAIWLYDTFAGMTQPTDHDLRHDGTRASDLRTPAPDGPGSSWWPADVDEVRANLASTGYPDHLVRFVVGPLEHAVPETAPDRIALLRLDTDWYESTLVELDHLYPLVERGGVVVVDDYGWWNGDVVPSTSTSVGAAVHRCCPASILQDHA